MMMLTEAIKKRITELCAERGITVNKLATLCGITQSTLSNLFNRPKTKPTVSTIKKICDGLDITLADFFSSPYFDGLEQEIE